MSTAHPTTAPARRRRLHWPAALTIFGLAATVAWTVGLSAGDRGKGKKLALPPDLAWVPSEAALFVQFRPADLWDTAPVKVLRRRLDKDMERFRRDVEKEIGIPVTETEKLILVFPSLGNLVGGGDGEARAEVNKAVVPEAKREEAPPREKRPPSEKEKPPAPDAPRGLDKPLLQVALQEEERLPRGPALWIVTVTRAAALERVRKEVVQNGEEHRVKGQVFYTLKADAVHFVNDRTFVRGSPRAVKQGLERKTRADAGQLAPALEKALGKHHLVVGIQVGAEDPRRLLRLFEGSGRGLRRTLGPLAAAKSGALWADAGKETTAAVELHFPDGTKARRGLDAARDALTLLRIQGVSEAIAGIEESLEDGAENETQEFFMMKFLERLESGLRGARSEQRGAVVYLSATADTDLEALDGKVAELLKAREKDEGARQARLRRLSANNLKQIGLALHGHHDAFKSLPPAAILSKKDGKPLLSWRVAILPYIEQGPLYQQFKLDEPWDSPNNSKLLESMPKFYAPVGVKIKEPFATFYRGFVAAPGGQFKTAWETNRNPNAPYGATGAQMPASFPDGTSNTIWVVEAGQAVPWTKPDELVYAEKKALPKLGGLFKDGFHVLMVDASVFFVRRRFDEQTLRAALTANGGEVFDPDKLTGRRR